jgi:hypothetical protein
MRQKSIRVRDPAERVVKDIRQATLRHFSAEAKIHVVLEGLRGEDSIAELWRPPTTYAGAGPLYGMNAGSKVNLFSSCGETPIFVLRREGYHRLSATNGGIPCQS